MPAGRAASYRVEHDAPAVVSDLGSGRIAKLAALSFASLTVMSLETLDLVGGVDAAYNMSLVAVSGLLLVLQSLVASSLAEWAPMYAIVVFWSCAMHAVANPNATVLGRGLFLLLYAVLGGTLALGWRWWRARHEPAGWAFVPVGAVALGAQLALASVGIGCQYAKGDEGCRALVGGLAGATGLILAGYSAAVLVVYRRPLPSVAAVVPETQNQPD